MTNLEKKLGMALVRLLNADELQEPCERTAKEMERAEQLIEEAHEKAQEKDCA